MEFRILGPLEVRRDGQAARAWAGSKQRALLALLLLDANRVVSRDRLIDALWEDDPPATAHKALQVYVSDLRKLLGRERLETRAPGYLLRVEPGELDLDRFQAPRRPRASSTRRWRCGAARRSRSSPASASRSPRSARLEELRLGCLEERCERSSRAGATPSSSASSRRLVRRAPAARAPAGAADARASTAPGARPRRSRRTARHAARWWTSSASSPAGALRELHQAILEQDPGLDLAAGAAPRHAARRARRSWAARPSSPSSSAGLDDAFAGHGRLFLLAGEPGIGKSRLAEELIAARRGARRAGARRPLLGGRRRAGVLAVGAVAARLRPRERRRDAARPARRRRRRARADPARAARALPRPPGARVARVRGRALPPLRRDRRVPAHTPPSARPLLLVLDDLHAADAALAAAAAVPRARAARRAACCVLAAYRDVDPVPGPRAGGHAGRARPASRSPRRLALAGSERAGASRSYVALDGARELASPSSVAALHARDRGQPAVRRARWCACSSAEGAGRAPLAVPERARRRSPGGSRTSPRRATGCLVLAVGARPRVRARRARPPERASPEDELLDAARRGDGRARHRRRARRARPPPLRPRADPRHALRGAHRRPGACGCTGGPSTRSRRCTASEPGRTSPSSRTTRSPAASSTSAAVRYATRAGDRGARAARLRGGGRLYETALEALDARGAGDERARCELLLVARRGAESRAGNDAAPRSRRSSRPPTSPGALGLRARARAARRPATAGASLWARAGGDERLVPLLEEGLAALGDEDVELRARLLARLAGRAARRAVARARATS